MVKYPTFALVKKPSHIIETVEDTLCIENSLFIEATEDSFRSGVLEDLLSFKVSIVHMVVKSELLRNDNIEELDVRL